MSKSSIIICFVITAMVGIALLTLVLKDKRRPMLLVAIHGILAAGSYGLLSYFVGNKTYVTSHYNLESYAFVAFSFAAMGGIYMLIRDKVLKQGLKKWMPFIHGGFAATGLIILILSAILGE
jgi:hypothetical protein